MPVSSLGVLNKKQREVQYTGKQKLEENKLTVGRKHITDELPGTLIHLLTLVQTSPMTLGESFLPATI